MASLESDFPAFRVLEIDLQTIATGLFIGVLSSAAHDTNTYCNALTSATVRRIPPASVFFPPKEPHGIADRDPPYLVVCLFAHFFIAKASKNITKVCISVKPPPRIGKYIVICTKEFRFESDTS